MHAHVLFVWGCFAGGLGLCACSVSSSEQPVVDASLSGAPATPGSQLTSLDAAVIDARVDPATDGSAAADGGAVLRLSTTGLYADVRAGTLAQGVQPFVPRGVLWSDRADKRRWVYLPPGTQVDTSDLDNWTLPVGTKLWKEFTLDGKRLETRLLEKTSAKDWTLVAYRWADDQTDAVAVPEGVPNVAGTTHDIPSSKDCTRCHEGVSDTAIGFSAIELAHDGEGLTLAGLVAQGRLTHTPDAGLALPGDAVEQAALLYLHANCGNCHNDRTFIANITNVDYRLQYGELAALEQTSSYRTIQRDLRIAKGDVESSKVIKRMSFRGLQGQMPPLASKIVDDAGLASVHAWVSRLSAERDAGASDAAAPASDGGP